MAEYTDLENQCHASHGEKSVAGVSAMGLKRTSPSPGTAAVAALIYYIILMMCRNAEALPRCGIKHVVWRPHTALPGEEAKPTRLARETQDLYGEGTKARPIYFPCGTPQSIGRSKVKMCSRIAHPKHRGGVKNM